MKLNVYRLCIDSLIRQIPLTLAGDCGSIWSRLKTGDQNSGATYNTFLALAMQYVILKAQKKKKKNASDPTFFQKDFCCLQHKKIKKVWRGLRSFEERLQSWHHGRIKEIRYNCSADRSAQLFIIAISSHCHIKRKQPQKIFLQYSCSVSKINIIKKYLWCKFCKVLYTKLPFFQKLTPYPHFFHLKSFL